MKAGWMGNSVRVWGCFMWLALYFVMHQGARKNVFLFLDWAFYAFLNWYTVLSLLCLRPWLWCFWGLVYGMSKVLGMVFLRSSLWCVSGLGQFSPWMHSLACGRGDIFYSMAVFHQDIIANHLGVSLSAFHFKCFSARIKLCRDSAWFHQPDPPYS